MQAEPLYTAEQIRIPPELPDILRNFTKYIIRTQPANIFEASAEYFGRLSKQGTAGETGTSRVVQSQLEAFYNKFSSRADAVVSRKDIDDECSAMLISPATVADIVRLGGWDGEKIPWMKFWSLLVASSAGTLTATIETVLNVIGDSGRVRLAPVIEVMQYLAEQDQTIDKQQVQEVMRGVMVSGGDDYDIQQFMDVVRREIKPGAMASKPSTRHTDAPLDDKIPLTAGEPVATE
ncbi:hypothetical protein BC832DRAFT_556040 [Gaertneriomyces semiglobifer]|nr:hypothetical protein BC832DRAFT_556040 [Gaertneriomyces semiglobifer]